MTETAAPAARLTAAQRRALTEAQRDVRYPGEHGPTSSRRRITTLRATTHRALNTAGLVDHSGFLTDAGIAARTTWA